MDGESIGRLKSSQRMKGREGNKMMRTSDNQAKTSSYKEGGLRLEGEISISSAGPAMQSKVLLHEDRQWVTLKFVNVAL